MISVEEAKDIITNRTQQLPETKMNVVNSVGHTVSENVVAKINIPSFDNSAMDGFSLIHSDIENGVKEFIILEDIKAGNHKKIFVRSGECAPIFTGAPIPNGADTIIMVEKTSEKDGKMIIKKGYNSTIGKHIRLLGEQIKEGKIALKKGDIINPSAASYLSALGETKVQVYSSPKVKIITTGNEIVQAGNPLKSGQIYESNSTALISLLKEQNVSDIYHEVGKDTIKELLSTLKDVEKYDIVILTGGISVGKYDFVADCLERIGVKKEFHKVAQKPGKPLYFGTKGNTLFFALPGNPAAVITSYYQYIYPAIQKMMGSKKITLKQSSLPLLQNVRIKANRANFLKGKISKEGVEVLSGQGSHILSSFAIADCLIYLPKGKKDWGKGENVEVHILPE
ncbi:MAG TPA: gephyrin-like molybdotransferase Glp [Flavobacteriales bacterium]|nr:gephyrin-like molybdotransferase Glp [Flavobacteriales bacterium]